MRRRLLGRGATGGLPYTPLYSIAPFYLGFSAARKLKADYTGFAYLAAKSGSVTQDIGFNADGSIDTAALLAFAAGGDAYINTWYDQSGNGGTMDIIGTTNAPQVVDSGVLITDVNGLPTVRFGSGNIYLRSNSVVNAALNNKEYGYFFQVMKQVAATSVYSVPFDMSRNVAGSSRFGIYFNRLTNGRAEFAGRRLNTDGFQSIQSSVNYPASQFLLTARADYATADAYLYFDGTQVATSASFQTAGATSATDSVAVDIGRLSNGALNWEGESSELLFYNDNQAANLSALNSNIQSYYSI